MHDPETVELVQRAARGEAAAMEALLSRYRAPLRRMVRLRLDNRLRGRVDPSDIVQEAQFDAARTIQSYAAQPEIPFYLWLRHLAVQRMIDQYRRHIGAQARDVSREIRLQHGALPAAQTAALAAQLLGRLTDPCDAAIRAERRVRLQEALNRMDSLDREILALRHFEQLSNQDAANLLQIEQPAASKRYARALVRLKEILKSMGLQ